MSSFFGNIFGNKKRNTTQAEILLEELIDLERANQEKQFSAESPARCDLCSKPFIAERFFVDGEVKGTPQVGVPDGTSMGQWANMCAGCFQARGVGVVWGSGQLYERKPNGTWLMMAGFPPPKNDA
jgi:hypothetical protein